MDSSNDPTPDSQPGEPTDSVLRWMNEFDRLWQEGARPQIEHYLSQVATEKRGELLEELLAVEIEVRRAAGETVVADQYQARFAEYSEQISRAFELVAVRSQSCHVTPALGNAPCVADKHVSINIFDLIDSICADFRREWKVGKRPRIEDRLPLVPDNARKQLFQNLLTLEIRYRQRAGDHVSPDDYLSRFPELKRAVGDAFHYSTSMSVEALKATPADDFKELTRTYEAPAANRIGDYELVRELGRGGFGVVYEARHGKSGNRVALKTLPTGVAGQEVNADRLYRFRREFRSLSEINHPNLVGMQTLEVDGSQWFFTMDLIEGVDFISFVRPRETFDESRLRESVKQLASGVVALHEQRILHRDLKPSNVLVGADGRVSILDFGLVAELEQGTDQTASLQTRHFAGTPRYAAPEQAFGERSPATDWYALGTMLFEALTGEPPFRGTAAELLIRKREEDAEQLAERDDLPEDLASLTDQLLRRAPEERPLAESIADALSVELSSASRSSHSSLSGEPCLESFSDYSDQILIGRGPQLEQLEAVKQDFLQRRKPIVVWISGLSGEGKSALAEKFLAPLRRSDEMLVFSGRCYDRESVPFKAVDVLIEALVRFLRSRPSEQVNAWLPRDLHMLAHLFPTMRRVEAVENASQGKAMNIDDRQVRYRAFFALRNLLINISHDTPLVVFIDDLQWGDADSAQVIMDLLAPPNPPATLLLGSYRSDEAEQSPFLLEWNRRDDGRRADRSIEVAPLTEEQCLSFLAQRVGVDADALREQARSTFTDTKGNPYFLEQLIEGFNEQTREFEPIPLHEVVKRKLERLPEEAAELLEVVAISGQALAVEEASQVVGNDTRMFSTITHMRSERLVRLIGSDTEQLVDTYHDKIRENVVDRISPDRKRELHLGLAEWVERNEGCSAEEILDSLQRSPDLSDQRSTHSGRISDLAYHFDAAGERQRACIYASAAAEEARAQFSLATAIERFQMAFKNSSDAPIALRCRIATGLAECHMLLGQYEEAMRQISLAIEFAQSAIELARIEVIRGELEFKRGLIQQSAKSHESALQRLGDWVPSSKFGLGCGLLSELAIQAGHSVLPTSSSGRTAVPTEREELTLRILNRITYPYFLSNSVKLFRASFRSMNMAERFGASEQLAFSYSLHPVFVSIIAWYSRGRYYSDLSLAMRQNWNDQWGQANTYTMRGLAVYQAAQYDECIDVMSRAVELLGDAGDLWEKSLAVFHRAFSHYRLGQINTAVEQAKHAFHECATRGEDSMAQHMLDVWARATRGDFPFDELRRAFRPTPEDILASCQLQMAEGHWHLHHNRTEEALAAFERGFLLPRKHVVVNMHTVSSLPWLATALRRHAETLDRTDDKRAVLLTRRASRTARWAARLMRFFPPDYPHALREYALSLFAQGKRRKAVRVVQKSCKAAEAQAAQFELAQSTLTHSQMQVAIGAPGSSEMLESAEARIAELQKIA